MVATMMLKEHDHTVEIASNGREDVELSVNEGFDLILMDLEMPQMDGIEATGKIREREIGTNNRVPIVAMTAHAMESDEQRGLDAGMDA